MATREQAEFYDKFIDHFKEQMNNPRNQGFRDWVKKWIHQPSKVLDLGCAFGYNSAFLAEMGCEVHGIDISSQCIMLARNKYPDCTWHCGDITDNFHMETKYKGYFDFVLMSDMIEHVPLDRHGILFQRLGELVRPGGALIVSIPNPEHFETAQQSTYQPVEEQVLIPELLLKMRAGNFSRVVSIFPWETFYYRMVMQKAND